MQTCAVGVDGDTTAIHAGEGGSIPTTALFRKGEYWLRDISQTTARELVTRHHYARGGSNTAVYRHGLFHRERPDECLGVAWWLPPTKDCGAKWWPEDPQAVLSLSRLVIVPEVPKNAATFLLMRSVMLIRKAGAKWRCLITQADTWQCHTGHIYKVAGWEECGLGDAGDVWVNPVSGKMVCRKSGPKTRNRAQMEALGYEFKGRHRKWRFKMILPAPPAVVPPVPVRKFVSLGLSLAQHLVKLKELQNVRSD